MNENTSTGTPHVGYNAEEQVRVARAIAPLPGRGELRLDSMPMSLRA